MDYTVVDNVLDNETFSEIQNTLLGEDFPWYYLPFVTFRGVDTERGEFYFIHHLFHNTEKSYFFNIIKPVLDYLNPKALIRIKANMRPRTDELVVNRPHSDYQYEHKGALFYINTNNGCTILEDGTKIESVANRLLLFDPSRPHQSTTCTDEKVRVNVNFNFF